MVLEPAAPPGLPAEANGSAMEPPGKRQKRVESGGEETPTEQLPGRMEAPQVMSTQSARQGLLKGILGPSRQPGRVGWVLRLLFAARARRTGGQGQAPQLASMAPL